MTKQSKYANELRALGFEPLTPELQKRYDGRVMAQLEALAARDGTALTRTRRRLIAKKRREPAFSIISDASGDDTFATDEHGIGWFAKSKSVDLSHLGFINAGKITDEAVSAIIRGGQSVN